jgi:glycosyltransferase involved in cell wall biosynthesis
MTEKGTEVDLVVLNPVGPLASKVPTGVHMVSLGTGQASRSLFALIRYLRRVRPSLLISHLHAVNMLAVVARNLAAPSVRLAVTIHNNVHLDLASENHYLRSVFPLLMRMTYPSADAIIAVSNGVAASISAAGIRSDHLKTVYNPVVSERLFTMASEPLDHPWFAPDQPPVILAVGRLERQKDHGTLLEAFQRVRQKRAARLLILGEGSDRHALEERARELCISDDVSFPGFVSNPYPFMRRAAVFALSSSWEGLPTVLIEALALGATIVSTDCPDGPREILADGKYGRLVPVGRADELATEIERALALGPSEDRSTEAWEKFTVDSAVNGYLAIGRDAIDVA